MRNGAARLPSPSLKSEEISFFCAQVALVLKAGIPLHDGVVMIAEDCPDRRLKAILGEIAEEVVSGAPLFRAMEKTGRFPPYVPAMIEIGETAGKLESVALSLAEYYEREKALAREIKRAVFYPAMLFVMMFVVIAIVVAKVLPIFGSVLRELGGEVSASASALLDAGEWIGRISLFLVFAVFLILCGLYAASKTQKGAAFVERLLYAAGPLKDLSLKISAGRFSSSMSLMLGSGLDFSRSLALSSELASGESAKKRILSMKDKIDAGGSFAGVLEASGLFPSLYAGMLKTGVKTGSLESVMQRIARLYEEETEALFSRLISSVEPALVTALAVVVGAILLTVLLPLTGIMSSIG